MHFFLQIFDEFFSGFRAKFQKIVTCATFSIKFAKTNQKFAENSEFCEKNSLLLVNYSLHSLITTISASARIMIRLRGSRCGRSFLVVQRIVFDHLQLELHLSLAKPGLFIFKARAESTERVRFYHLECSASPVLFAEFSSKNKMCSSNFYEILQKSVNFTEIFRRDRKSCKCEMWSGRRQSVPILYT